MPGIFPAHHCGRATTAPWGSRIVPQSNRKAAGGAVMLRPRICYILSLLRIHSLDCTHCMVRLTCGDELRKRLEELNGWMQHSQDKTDSRVSVSAFRRAA